MLSHWYNHDNFGFAPYNKSCEKTYKHPATNMKTGINLLNVTPDNECSPCRTNNNRNRSGSFTALRDPLSASIRLPWKIVILGDAGVGKSSLVKRFLGKEFNEIYCPTVEDNYMHNINLPYGITQSVEILDTSGFYQFPAMKELNIRMATAFILVFDLTQKESLKNIIELHQIIKNIKGDENILIILVGNKVDKLSKKNKIPSSVSQMANELAEESLNCAYIESSAKCDVNVSKIFSEIIELITAMNNDSQDQLANRRSSLLSFVRRLSNIHLNHLEKSRSFSEPNVLTKINLPEKAEISNKNSKDRTRKCSPNTRKMRKTCTIS